NGDKNRHNIEALLEAFWRQHCVFICAARVAAFVALEGRTQAAKNATAVVHRRPADRECGLLERLTPRRLLPTGAFSFQVCGHAFCDRRPHSRATKASARSMPAVTPADVATRSCITKRVPSRIVICPYSRRRSNEEWCVVAESPSSIPAAARMSAPVQTETTVPLWRRTNSRTCGFSLTCVLAPSPPGTISRSRAGASCKMQSGTTCSPWRQRTYSGWCAITRDREIRVQRLEGGGVGDVIDGIEPDLLRQRRVQHGG